MALYPHQRRVRDLLMDGKSVILQAPTGAGKTRAAIEPFLHSVNLAKYGDGGFLPHRLIYSVPMRVLAKQFNVEYDRALKRFNDRKKTELQKAIQTGDMQQDRELTKNLIFATVDQTISSFLMAPYSLSRGQANLNLGAILSSYLVFDEFHLYDPDSTMPTVLQMLRMLRGITPFVLMTATFSEELIGRLGDKLGAELVGLSAEERAQFTQLDSQQKIRRYHTQEAPLSANVVLAHHQQRSVVICNTVDRARTLYQRLANHPERGDTEVILLHSRFLREDRDRIEDRIRALFGKGHKGDGSVIVVATQAIEVGVDITSTVMHTELAPANAIIQRAGRCARYKGNEGDVYVYRYSQDGNDETIDLVEKPNPYGGRLEKQQLPRTFEVLQGYSGQVLTFDDEQRVIDAVHADTDRQILNDMDATANAHRASMFAAMRGDSEQVGELVRKVIAQPVTVQADPKSEAVMRNPYRVPSFNLHPGTLRQYVDQWMAHYHQMDDDDAPPFGVKWLKADTDPDNSSETIYKWEEVGWDDEKEKAAPIPYGSLVVVHPTLATYDPNIGFIPDHGGANSLPIPEYADKARGNFTYRLETYAEHIRLVHKAAFEDDRDINHSAYWHEAEWGAAHLAERIGCTYDDLRRAAELTILLHDVGKLSTGWQGWVREYQQQIGMPTDPNEAYAHTERQTDQHIQIERSMGKRRPPHAVESAVAIARVLITLPEALRRAVFTAISRHHGAFTEGYQTFRLEKYAAEKVKVTFGESVALVDGKTVRTVPAAMFAPVNHDEIDTFFAYAMLVRLLRRSDTRGTAWGSRPGTHDD